MVKKTSSNVKGTSCSMSWVNICIVIVLLAIAIWLYFKLFAKSSPAKSMERFLERKESFNFDGVKNCESTTKPFSLNFFYMETCPHCVDFKPIWGKFQKQLGNSSMSSKVCMSDISAENDSILGKYNVTSFPTVLLVQNNANTKPKVFEGERTVEGLMKFISQNVAS